MAPRLPSRKTAYAASASGSVNSRVTAPARESAHRLMGGFGDPRIAVAPQERVADADANPGQVARASLRDKTDRIDPGRIKRGKPEGYVGDATRQQPRRIESERQRYDAFGRPAPDRDLQADIAGHGSGNAHRTRCVAAERERRRAFQQADAGTARRTADRAVCGRVPGVVGRPPVAVLSGAAERKLDHVGLAHDDPELPALSRDQRSVAFPRVLRQPHG